jgi:plastocyanin
MRGLAVTTVNNLEVGMRRFPVLVVAAAFAAIVAGCGNAGGTSPRQTPGGAHGSVNVVAQDIKFAQGDFEVDAGTVDVSYRNEGNIAHTLVIEDVGGFKLSVSGQGDVDQGAVELAAGEYTIYCDVAGHRQAGMEATLTVR